MERIDIPSGFFPLRPEKQPEKRVSRKKPAKRSLFSALDVEESGTDESGLLFHSGAIELTDEQIEAMLDDIHRLGDVVRKETSLPSIRDYRKAVSAFIHVVVERGLIVEENVSGRNVLNRKKFALIKVIDEKLERLALGILQTQKDQFDILARVDEINGLLVDLLR
jgi:hypothetical protein